MSARTWLGVVIASAMSLGGFAKAQASPAPAYSALPIGGGTVVPAAAKRPASISVRERVPGFFVVRPMFGPGTPARARHVTVTRSRALADAARSGRPASPEERNNTFCLTEPRFAEDGMAVGDSPREWGGSTMNEVLVWPRTSDNPHSGVTAVHSEELVDQNGSKSLVSVDVWVDPMTLGTRLIARATLPLSRVTTAVGGLEIYAAREERSGGKRVVHFVVVRPNTTATAQAGALVTTTPDGEATSSSGCELAHVKLTAAPNDGETALVLAPMEIPSRDEERAERAEDVPARETKSERMLVGLPKRGLGRKFLRPTAPPPAPTEPHERDVRIRMAQIHLSVSQTSRDREPVVAVSLGWAGREDVERILDGSFQAVHD